MPPSMPPPVWRGQRTGTSASQTSITPLIEGTLEATPERRERVAVHDLKPPADAVRNCAEASALSADVPHWLVRPAGWCGGAVGSFLSSTRRHWQPNSRSTRVHRPFTRTASHRPTLTVRDDHGTSARPAAGRHVQRRHVPGRGDRQGRRLRDLLDVSSRWLRTEPSTRHVV